MTSEARGIIFVEAENKENVVKIVSTLSHCLKY